MKKIELLMDKHGVDLAITRITHQVIERNRDFSKFGIVGMQTRGVFLAKRIADKIKEIEDMTLEIGTLDITLYRDDYHVSLRHPEVKVTNIPFDITEMNILLVDDVLYTGRTVRAALDALMDFGRPKTIQLAVLIDRGNRELPIHADYVGKIIKTLHKQEVALKVSEIDGEDSVWLMEVEEGERV